jgi:L-aspartate oxidase
MRLAWNKNLSFNLAPAILLGLLQHHQATFYCMNQTDVLIIGSGIGGLSTAIQIAEKRPDLKITVLTKTVENESNTRYAQGGVAAVWNEGIDSFEKHIEDTLDAGDGLCNLDAVRHRSSPKGRSACSEIIGWGARFDKDHADTGQYDLGREGGHSENRILHYKDLTGWEIQRALSAKADEHPNIEVHEHYFAIDIITQHHLGHTITRVTPDIECYGAYVLDKNTGQIETFLAHHDGGYRRRRAGV